MKRLLLLSLVLGSCTVSPEASKTGEPPTPTSRALACPGDGDDDICLLFDDTSAAALSYSPTTDGTLAGDFLTAGYSIPVTGRDEGDSTTFYFCPVSSSSRLSQSTLSISDGPNGELTASLWFKLTSWQANMLGLRTRAFDRSSFPESTTAPDKNSVTGEWVPYGMQETTTSSFYISKHDRLLLFFFGTTSPCDAWYGVAEDEHQFRIPTGWESIPEGYASTYGYFAEDFMSGAITSSTDGCLGGCPSEETWKFKRR